MGRGLKGTRMEVPPPFAILQASRGAKRRSTAWQEEPGGGWRSAGIWGEFLESESFYFHLDEEEEMWREGSKFINIKIKI